MLQFWLVAAAAASLLQNPIPNPQGPPQPGVTPGLAPPPGADVNPAASQPAMPPPLTPEQVAERLALQVTGLSARIQSLRKTANIATAVDVSSIPAPESRPSVDTLRTMLGEVSRELQTRAHAVEVKVASSTADRLLHERSFPLTGFKPATDPKVVAAAPGTVNTGPALPAFDKAKASDVVYNVGSTPITRGEIEGMVELIRPFMAEATLEQVASTVLRRTLIQSAILRNSFAQPVTETLMRAKKIHADVAANKLSFEDAVKQFSEEAGVKTFGGVIDGASAGLVSDFEHRAIAGLKKGDVSEPFVANATVEMLQLLDVKPGPTPAQTTYKFRRLVMGIDIGVIPSERFNKLAELLRSTSIAVVDPAYEPFLPPSVQRTVGGVRTVPPTNK